MVYDCLGGNAPSETALFTSLGLDFFGLGLRVGRIGGSCLGEDACPLDTIDLSFSKSWAFSSEFKVTDEAADH
jgi:hypothetical protein